MGSDPINLQGAEIGKGKRGQELWPLRSAERPQLLSPSAIAPDLPLGFALPPPVSVGRRSVCGRCFLPALPALLAAWFETSNVGARVMAVLVSLV